MKMRDRFQDYLLVSIAVASDVFLATFFVLLSSPHFLAKAGFCSHRYQLETAERQGSPCRRSLSSMALGSLQTGLFCFQILPDAISLYVPKPPCPPWPTDNLYVASPICLASQFFHPLYKHFTALGFIGFNHVTVLSFPAQTLMI